MRSRRRPGEGPSLLGLQSEASALRSVRGEREGEHGTGGVLWLVRNEISSPLHCDDLAGCPREGMSGGWMPCSVRCLQLEQHYRYASVSIIDDDVEH